MKIKRIYIKPELKCTGTNFFSPDVCDSLPVASTVYTNISPDATQGGEWGGVLGREANLVGDDAGYSPRGQLCGRPNTSL